MVVGGGYPVVVVDVECGQGRDVDAEFLLLGDELGELGVVVVFLQIDLPVMVQVLQCPDLLGLCLGDEIIHDLMEFLDFPLGFPAFHRCMGNPDGKPAGRDGKAAAGAARPTLRGGGADAL